jgi:hypothetical protein
MFCGKIFLIIMFFKSFLKILGKTDIEKILLKALKNVDVIEFHYYLRRTSRYAPVHLSLTIRNCLNKLIAARNLILIKFRRHEPERMQMVRGCRAGIRTPIHRFRVCGPTVRRPGNLYLYFIILFQVF